MSKKTDAPKKCWSCGADAMRPEGSFYKCKKCGATDVDLPTPMQGPFLGQGRTEARKMMKGK